MPDYQILKITIDKARPNEKVYFRRELVGSTTLGGERNPPYPKEKIVRDHANKLEKAGENGTLLDRAAANAETIDVEVLYKDELRDCEVVDVNRFRRTLIAKFKENNPDWPERLLNIK